MSEKRLIWFHGRECPHCRKLEPLVDQFEEQNGIKLLRLEVWHNEENAKLMRSMEGAIAPACGGDLGVPAFYNEVTGKAICGRIDLEKLKNWAKG
jgi:thiol-disulfide isomerase/thioredoxin